MHDHLKEHQPLNRAKTFNFTTVDAAFMPLNHQFSIRKKSPPGSSRKTSQSSRKTSQSSWRKKSEVMIVPSLRDVKRTAPNARYFDSIKTLFR